VADRVTFHGQVGHELVLDVLDAGDVFLFPTSSNEGFPKAVGEALACGLPVVASAVSVLPSLLDHGAGIVLREVTSRAIANAVEDLRSAPDVYAAMSRRAIELAQTLTLERWATEVARAIDDAGLVCHTRSR
jgi:glycosyltransferase involved in cell wall biosynthesis